jgi:hypothetical protein
MTAFLELRDTNGATRWIRTDKVTCIDSWGHIEDRRVYRYHIIGRRDPISSHLTPTEFFEAKAKVYRYKLEEKKQTYRGRDIPLNNGETLPSIPSTPVDLS